MGPVRQNPIQRTVRSVHNVCASHCAQLLHIILHRTYPPDNQTSDSRNNQCRMGQMTEISSEVLTAKHFLPRDAMLARY